MKTNDVQQWLKEIREVANEARNPKSDVKLLNCFLNAAGKNLAYLRFAEHIKKDALKVRPLRKGK